VDRAPLPWPEHPVVFEVATWPWLTELGQTTGKPVELGSVPDAAWDALCAPGVDAVWLMGVWERSPVGRAIARAEPDLQRAYRAVLPDVVDDDVVGSPYCVRSYTVDPHLGGEAGLAAARAELAARGVRLVLDLVPNHVAWDHPWVVDHPERFVHGTDDDLAADPTAYRRVGDHVLACGRDPHWPAWTDVAQLDVSVPSTRTALVAEAVTIADRCDGLRCDMAVLVLHDVFARTWGDRVGPLPATELWTELWAAVRAEHPAFLAVAEAYWDLEWDLQQLGFDHCYDKRLLDRLTEPGDSDVDAVRAHLDADAGFQHGLVRFLENHDEPRIAAKLPADRARAATVLVATLPGALLLQQGQREGHRTRVPVQLGRRAAELTDDAVAAWWDRVAAALSDGLRRGAWARCPAVGWPDDPTHRSLLAWCWRDGGRRWLVVVNWSDGWAHGRVRLPWGDLDGRVWRWTDRLVDVVHERDGDELAAAGLSVALGPWGSHVLVTDS
jgi:hypothetical protein